MDAQHQELKRILEQIRSKTPRSYILMSPNSIGEVITTCTLAKSFIEQHGYPITLCVRPEHDVLVRTLYPGRFAAIVTMSMDTMRAFHTSGFVPNGHFDIDMPIVLSPLHYDNGRILELHNLIYKREGRSGLIASDFWRYMMRLSWDSQIELPSASILDTSESVLAKFGVESQKYVLFQLGNNTNKPMPTAFWQQLEKVYSARGYKILVNLQGAMLFDKTLSFSNAVQINSDILETLILMQHSATTVTGSNGLTMINLLFGKYIPNDSVMHVLMGEEYCHDYSLLNSDWDKAFKPFEGTTSIYYGCPDFITKPDSVMEWKVRSQPKGGDADFKVMAEDLANKNKLSPYFFKSDFKNASVK